MNQIVLPEHGTRRTRDRHVDVFVSDIENEYIVDDSLGQISTTSLPEWHHYAELEFGSGYRDKRVMLVETDEDGRSVSSFWLLSTVYTEPRHTTRISEIYSGRQWI